VIGSDAAFRSPLTSAGYRTRQWRWNAGKGSVRRQRGNLLTIERQLYGSRGEPS